MQGEAEVIARLLPSLLQAYYPTQQIMTSVMGAFPVLLFCAAHEPFDCETIRYSLFCHFPMIRFFLFGAAHGSFDLDFETIGHTLFFHLRVVFK